MILLLVPLRIVLILFVLLCFFIIGLLNQLFFFFNEEIRKTVAQRNTQWACYLHLLIFNIKVDYKISKPFPKGSLLVCNHLSYTDIFVIASKFPTLFVTSLEMKRKPFLGWITQLGECLYVDRKSHKNINNEVEFIQQKLSNGFNVLIFPESTTSNGLKIKPFKSSLLKVADGSSHPLITYCLKFTHVNHKSVTSNQLPKLAWHSEESFFTHVIRLLTIISINCELKEIERVTPIHFTNRKSLTEHLFQQVSGYYNQ